jgi:hypothetical protein
MGAMSRSDEGAQRHGRAVSNGARVVQDGWKVVRSQKATTSYVLVARVAARGRRLQDRSKEAEFLHALRTHARDELCGVQPH